MRYSGSKKRIIKYILPIITEHLDNDTTFIDAFGGGMNVVSEIDHNRKIAVELNKYVCALWNTIKQNTAKGMKTCEYIPMEMTQDKYLEIKEDYLNDSKHFPEYITGYTATALSYGGAWFNGYAKYNPKKNEDHILEAFNGITKQVLNFKELDNTEFVNASYDEIKLPEKAVIYCDPPYQNTKGYENKNFDHNKFWQWCRDRHKQGYKIYVSEYNAPDDFKCVWQMVKKDGMGTTKQGNKQKIKIEKLFTPK